MEVSNYPVVPFPDPIEPPAVDPDSESAGGFVAVVYAAEWLPAVTAAAQVLAEPQTYIGDETETIQAIQRGEDMMNILAGNAVVISPGNLEFRRKPGDNPDQFRLQFRINGGNWTDSAYNLADIYLEKALFDDPRDENGVAVGTWDITVSPKTVNNVLPITWGLRLNRAAFQGATGANGLPATMFINSQNTLNPNASPTVSITPSSGNSYGLNFGLPRAAKFFVDDVYGLPAGSTPVFNALPRLQTGDYDLEIGIPAGATGATGQPGQPGQPGEPGQNGRDGLLIDETPPDGGAFKHYKLLVPATGAMIPFQLLAGWQVQNVVTVGKWLNRFAAFPERQKVTGGNVGGTFPQPGQLVLIPSDNTGTDPDGYNIFPNTSKFDPFSGDFTMPNDGWIQFRQEAEVIFDPESGGFFGTIGEGYIEVEFDVQASIPNPIVQFTNNQGAVSTASQIDNKTYELITNGVTNGQYQSGLRFFDPIDGTTPVDVEIVDIEVIDRVAPAGLCVDGANPLQCEYRQTVSGTTVTRSPSVPDSFYYPLSSIRAFWHNGYFKIRVTIA